MFGLFKPPIETRLFPVIWPQPNDNVIEMCRTDAGLTCPTAVIQAATAIANLAIANHYLVQQLPAARAQDVTADIERLIFGGIAEHDFPCVAADILKLAEERKEWCRFTGVNVETPSNLSTIMRAVFGMRMHKYRADMAKAMEAAIGGAFHGYGPMAYVAKRWLSQLCGRPIVRSDDLSEEGFRELGVASLYFTYKAKEMVAATDRLKSSGRLPSLRSHS